MVIARRPTAPRVEARPVLCRRGRLGTGRCARELDARARRGRPAPDGRGRRVVVPAWVVLVRPAGCARLALATSPARAGAGVRAADGLGVHVRRRRLEVRRRPAVRRRRVQQRRRRGRVARRAPGRACRRRVARRLLGVGKGERGAQVGSASCDTRSPPERAHQASKRREEAGHARRRRPCPCCAGAGRQSATSGATFRGSGRRGRT